MAWLVLVLAGLLEVVFTYFLKLSEGLTKPGPTVGFVLGSVGSFALLNQAVKTIPIGTAYAVWTGIGATGTALVGILVFGEPASAARLCLLCLIVAAVIGLRLVD
jgi:quaternary ammonium compound-resistance protein SugE